MARVSEVSVNVWGDDLGDEIAKQGVLFVAAVEIYLVKVAQQEEYERRTGTGLWPNEECVDD